MWRRVLRRAWLWLLAVSLMLAGSIFSWLTGSYLLATALGAVLLAAVLVLATLWRAHFANTIGKYRRMRPPEAHFTFRDDGMDITSSLATATVFWPSFLEVWELPDCWMLFAAPNQFITLPILELPPATLTFIRTHCPPPSAST